MSEGTARRAGGDHIGLVRAVALAVLVTISISITMALVLPTAASAELRRIESVGIYGIHDSTRTRVIPRDEAIAKARWEGISRVALELIGESEEMVDADSDADAALDLALALALAPDPAPDPDPDAYAEPLPFGEQGSTTDNMNSIPNDGGAIPPLEQPGGDSDRLVEAMVDPEVDSDDVRFDRVAPSADEATLLRSALGKDMLPYTRSYRILEDQGELPVLFNDDPGVETEYVVVIEVIVDVDRIGAALEAAGLVAVVATPGSRAVTVELVGLVRYEALETALAALRGPLGATRVETVEFERERQLLSVVGPYGAEGLADRIRRFRDPQLILEPIGLDPVYGRLRVLGRWFPAPEETFQNESGVTDSPAS